MAMTAGSVSVAPDGGVTKSGLAEAIFDAFINNFEDDTDCQIPAGPEGVPIKKGYAIMASRLATALVIYITTNATANVSGSVSGLQKSTSVGTLTDPHGGTTINLPIT